MATIPEKKIIKFEFATSKLFAKLINKPKVKPINIPIKVLTLIFSNWKEKTRA